MKKVLVCLTLSAILAAICFAQSNQLVGTWELVSTKGTMPDGTTWDWNVARDGGRALKVISPTHFSGVTHGADGKFVNAHAGTYDLRSNTYTEHIEYSSAPGLVDQKNPITFTLEGDTVRFSYVLPSNGAKAEEVWRRVKPSREGS